MSVDVEVRVMKPLLGKTLTEAEQISDDTISLVRDDGKRFLLTYIQDCCASCTIEDIDGNLNDLIGSPLTQAEMVFHEGDSKRTVGLNWNNEPSVYEDDSSTWTFVKLATTKGHVVLRWYGSSNGYYSETPTLTSEADPFGWNTEEE